MRSQFCDRGHDWLGWVVLLLFPEPKQANGGNWWVGWELLGLGSVERVLAVG